MISGGLGKFFFGFIQLENISFSLAHSYYLGYAVTPAGCPVTANAYLGYTVTIVGELVTTHLSSWLGFDT